VMYRALTLAAMRAGLDLHDGAALEALAVATPIEVLPAEDGGSQATVRVGGEDVTAAIRAREVERNVSLVAAHPGVRRELVRQQQMIGRRGRVVMVGRDIGTIVMPDAELKVFLETTLDERARRRADDIPDSSLANVRDALARRDALDEHVLRPAPDAVRLTTDGLSPDDEVAWIIALIASRPEAKG
jgi:CMP/dCMP kinase